MDIAIDAVQIHGSKGCCNKYPVNQFLREANILKKNFEFNKELLIDLNLMNTCLKSNEENTVTY